MEEIAKEYDVIVLGTGMSCLYLLALSLGLGAFSFSFRHHGMGSGIAGKLLQLLASLAILSLSLVPCFHVADLAPFLIRPDRVHPFWVSGRRYWTQHTTFITICTDIICGFKCLECQGQKGPPH